ncbi:hypothetical protein QE380_000222 [Acinetobacter baylyi]|uniref:Uncharacterized protein n=1 Tax=Acinetobacter baylyi TaxID=202950 RepID=A0ABU0URY2_ACIBI|nr:hypothetical protein [Acinetobacter baylyi]MDQ1207299.1 hypothetical protein [Acinetobacter baylyi]MDR6105619.1 hypothetical protein [Acinetobacter baylyi]MDR6187660.1 hypothetical protein [Acinetobacter baylyi]
MSNSKDLPKKPVKFYTEDSEILEYSKNLLNFSEWAKTELRKLLVDESSIPVKKIRSKGHGELITNRVIVFSENDSDILELSKKLNLSEWIKQRLLIELNEKKLKGETIEKLCVICGKVNFRNKYTCSDECEKIHRKQLLAHADKLRVIRDKEKRAEYQKQYWLNVRKDKLKNNSR